MSLTPAPPLARFAEERDADGEEIVVGDVLGCISHGREQFLGLGHD
jgi:hypothetical protein